MVTALAVPDRLLTRRRAAERLGVGAMTVDRYRRADLLAAVATPSGWRYRAADVDQARYRLDHGGYCPECSYPFTAPGHEIECEGKP